MGVRMVIRMGGVYQISCGNMRTHADSSGLLERSPYEEFAWVRSLYLRVRMSPYSISYRRSLCVRVRIGAKSSHRNPRSKLLL